MKMTMVNSGLKRLISAEDYTCNHSYLDSFKSKHSSVCDARDSRHGGVVTTSLLLSWSSKNTSEDERCVRDSSFTSFASDIVVKELSEVLEQLSVISASSFLETLTVTEMLVGLLPSWLQADLVILAEPADFSEVLVVHVCTVRLRWDFGECLQDISFGLVALTSGT